MFRTAQAVTLSAVAALALAGCGVLRPVGDLDTHRVEADWGTRLYELDALAYQPSERGEPLRVDSDATPDGGLVVVPSKDRWVRGVAARTGEVLWKIQTNGPNVSRPTAVGEDVLVASMDGRVYRLRQRNGRPVWKTDVLGRGALVSAPVVDDGRVFVTGSDNRLTALSLEDGSSLWERQRPHRGEFTITGQAGATVVGDAVVTGFSDGNVVAYAVSDGAILWTADLSRGESDFVDVDSTPLVLGDTVVVASYATGVHALDVDTGAVRWRLEGRGYGTAAALDGLIYVPRADGRLVAIDAEAGEVSWASRIRYGTPGTPALTRKYVLVPVRESLLVLDRGTGRLLLRYDDGFGVTATPHVAWGTAYTQANSGHLYALGIY
ncbi:MAG: PQQ-binding-like beta-propeller repeat protein [Myxococcota bacterium]